MRVSADEERRLHLANLQLNLSIAATLAQDDETANKALLRFHDLVDALEDEVEAERLRGHAAWLQKDTAQAVKHFKHAYLTNHDLRAITYLTFLSPETAKRIAAPEDQRNVNALIDEQFEQLDPFFALNAFRSQLLVGRLLERDDLLLSEKSISCLYDLGSPLVLDEGEDLAKLQARAPDQASAIRRAQLGRRWLMGDGEALLELLALGQQDPYALFDLGQILIPFSETYDPATRDGEIGEVNIRYLGKKPGDFAMNLIIEAHEAGVLGASVFLAAQSYQPSWLTEISNMLKRLFPREPEPLALILGFGAPVSATLATSHVDQGEDMEALKTWRDMSQNVLDRAASGLGEMLMRESDGKGPWALLGNYLERWGLGTGDKKDPLTPNEVGSHDYPLVQRPLASNDLLPQLDPPAEIRKRVKRLMDSLEQSDTKSEVIGDLIRATWAEEQGPITVNIKVAQKGHDFLVQTFLPLLIAKPDPGTVEVPLLDEFLRAERKTEMLELLGVGSPGLNGLWFHGITHRHFGITRASLEALFQLGENSSRDVWLNQWFNIHRFLGRHATFASPQTNKYFPSAWFSLVTVDSLIPWMAEGRVGIKFIHNAAVMFVGYEFSADQNARRLKEDLEGAIHSVHSMTQLVTELFETQPAVFQEIFDAIPVLKTRAHLDELQAELVGGQGSKKLSSNLGDVRAHMAENLSTEKDGLSQNDAGAYFQMNGEHEKALACFENAAKVGLPNAVASLVWLNTVLDEHQKAVAAFEKYFLYATQYIDNLRGLQIPSEEVIDGVTQEISSWLQSLNERDDLSDEDRTEGLAEAAAVFSLQIPNIQSNAAISYFALGNFKRANELWGKVAHEHSEAPMFMAVAARRQGQDLGGLPPIDPEKLDDLINDCDSALKHAVGWAKDWYDDCQTLIIQLQNQR